MDMKTKSDKRKTYMKPAMQVFELRRQPQILVGSGLGNPDDYDHGDDPFQF